MGGNWIGAQKLDLGRSRIRCPQKWANTGAGTEVYLIFSILQMQGFPKHHLVVNVYSLALHKAGSRNLRHEENYLSLSDRNNPNSRLKGSAQNWHAIGMHQSITAIALKHRDTAECQRTKHSGNTELAIYVQWHVLDIQAACLHQSAPMTQVGFHYYYA